MPCVAPYGWNGTGQPLIACSQVDEMRFNPNKRQWEGGMTSSSKIDTVFMCDAVSTDNSDVRDECFHV